MWLLFRMHKKASTNTITQTRTQHRTQNAIHNTKHNASTTQNTTQNATQRKTQRKTQCKTERNMRSKMLITENFRKLFETDFALAATFYKTTALRLAHRHKAGIKSMLAVNPLSLS
jgi:hypothetical protein